MRLLRNLFTPPEPGDRVTNRDTGGVYEVCSIDPNFIRVRLWNGDRIPKQPSNLAPRSPLFFWAQYKREPV